MKSVEQLEVSVYQKAKKGNVECGDSYFYQQSDTQFICAVADGLGSGEFAKESSEAVMEVVSKNSLESIETIINRCKSALTNKRGVVLGILKIDFERDHFSFASIGNIGIIIDPIEGKKKRNIPVAGYIGGQHRPFKVKTEPLKKDMLFFMFTDGVSDSMLSSELAKKGSIHDTVDNFKNSQLTKLEDDTTLIGIKY